MKVPQHREPEPERPAMPPRYSRVLDRVEWWNDPARRAGWGARMAAANVEDWHTTWGHAPLEVRREILIEQGRPDLINEEVCERFGIR